MEVPVTVTYPDGSVDNEKFTVTVSEGNYKAIYEDAKGEPDTDIVAKPKKADGTDDWPEDTKFSKGDKPNEDKGVWKFTGPEADTGNITGSVAMKDLAKKYEEKSKELVGDKCVPGESFTKEKVTEITEYIKDLMSATAFANVDFAGTLQKDAPAQFILTKDGKPLAEHQDWDGDGYTNIEEIENCSNPLDPDSKPEKPADNPDWDDTETEPKKPVDIPNTGGPVKDGTTVETSGPGKAELNPDGSITVTPNDDAKPGDKIVVTVKDPNGDEIDTVTVTIKEPSDGDNNGSNKPDWEDATTTPTKPVDLPNVGKKVQPGTKVAVTDGPGIAKLNDDESITVTPNGDANIGDKITVVVTDSNGNRIDTVTVTIRDPKNPDWDDASTEPKKPVDVPKTKDSGDVKPGTTAEVAQGPGTAKLNPDNSVRVTPNDDAKAGDTIFVTVKDKDGNTVDNFKVTVKDPAPTPQGPSSNIDGSKCVPALIGWSVPLLALIPLGIASQVAIPGLEGLQQQIGEQIKNVNTELQRQLGLMNPELAETASRFDDQLKAAGSNLTQTLAGLAILAYGIGALAHILSVCLPTDNVPAEKQSSQENLPRNIAGSSFDAGVVGSSDMAGSSQDGGNDSGSAANVEGSAAAGE